MIPTLIKTLKQHEDVVRYGDFMQSAQERMEAGQEALISVLKSGRVN